MAAHDQRDKADTGDKGNQAAGGQSGQDPRQLIWMGLLVAVTLPGIALRIFSMNPRAPVAASLFGLSIVGSAFLLSWAAEAAQVDISAGLAIAVLAFIAVLPEYAVDLVFAWKGGNAVQAFGEACKAPGAVTESSCSLALANMTGANRLLIGIGWPLVMLIAWYRSGRRARRQPEGGAQGRGALREICLARSHAIEISYLALATAYSLTLPLKSSITLLDAAVLVGIFVAYTVRISTAPPEEPHLVGPARYLGGLGKARRRIGVVGLFLFAAGVILLCAEPFAESLVHTGQDLGINEFLLVQWVAPLASEAPELLVAGIYAWRLNTGASLGTLVSSKVNQWTLLVGTLPIVFALSSSTLHGLPVEPQQREELLLTAAQSFFAIATLATLSLSLLEAAGLFVLFLGQFLVGVFFPSFGWGWQRLGVSVMYLVLGLLMLVQHRRYLLPLLRDGFRTPHEELCGLRKG